VSIPCTLLQCSEGYSRQGLMPCNDVVVPANSLQRVQRSGAESLHCAVWFCGGVVVLCSSGMGPWMSWCCESAPASRCSRSSWTCKTGSTLAPPAQVPQGTVMYSDSRNQDTTVQYISRCMLEVLHPDIALLSAPSLLLLCTRKQVLRSSVCSYDVLGCNWTLCPCAVGRCVR